MEKKLKREEIYNGKVIRVVKDDVELDDKKTSVREVVIHRGGACVALKDDDGKFFLVKQYRYCQEKEMLEFCAGKLEIGESADLTVYREAEEELGYKIKNVKKFGYIIPTCGYSNEKIYLYYAEVDRKVQRHLDEDENIDVYKYTFDEIKQMIRNEEIDDAKTIALMYRMEMEGLDK